MSSNFRYAIATGRATVNPATELTGTLEAPKTKHFPHLTVQDLPELLQKLSEYTGSPIPPLAPKLQLLTGVRTWLPPYGEHDLHEKGLIPLGLKRNWHIAIKTLFEEPITMRNIWKEELK